MKCAILFCFFGFLRQSNVAPRSPQLHDPSRDTLRSDVRYTPTGLLLRLKWTKTHQVAHRPVLIPLPSIPGSFLCPTAAFRQMCTAIPARSSNAPLLFYYTPQHLPTMVTTRMLANQFQQFIQHLNLPPHTFTLHSLRKGGATLCHTKGLSVDQIKAHGTWSSDSVWTYIQPNTSAIAMAMSEAVTSYHVS